MFLLVIDDSGVWTNIRVLKQLLTEITAANRHNIEVVHLVKNPSGKGEVQRQSVNYHRQDFSVL